MWRAQICVIVMMICPAAGSAQLFYGIKGGLNIADIAITNFVDPDTESDYDLKLGVHAGVFAGVSASERYALKAELIYSNKGVNAITNIHLHYINVPLLLQYNMSEKFTVEVGPELGYLFSAKSKYGDVSNTWNNKLDIGADAGIECKLTSRMWAAMRYNAGFSNVMGPKSSAPNTARYKNRVLQFSLLFVLAERKL